MKNNTKIWGRRRKKLVERQTFVPLSPSTQLYRSIYPYNIVRVLHFQFYVHILSRNVLLKRNACQQSTEMNDFPNICYICLLRRKSNYKGILLSRKIGLFKKVNGEIMRASFILIGNHSVRIFLRDVILIVYACNYHPLSLVHPR